MFVYFAYFFFNKLIEKRNKLKKVMTLLDFIFCIFFSLYLSYIYALIYIYSITVMNFLFLALSWQTATLLVSLKLWKTLCGSAEGGARKLTQFMWITCKWHHLPVSYTIAHLNRRLFRSSLFSSTKNQFCPKLWDMIQNLNYLHY